MFRKKFIDRLRDKYQKGGVKYNTFDKLQDTLTTAGLIPGVGAVPDAINTVISGGRAAYNYATGDTQRAKSQMGDLALNAASIIPVAGQGAGIAKLAKSAIKVSDPAYKTYKGVKKAKKIKALATASTDNFNPNTNFTLPKFTPQTNTTAPQYTPLPPGGFAAVNKSQTGGIKEDFIRGVRFPVVGDRSDTNKSVEDLDGYIANNEEADRSLTRATNIKNQMDKGEFNLDGIEGVGNVPGQYRDYRDLMSDKEASMDTVRSNFHGRMFDLPTTKKQMGGVALPGGEVEPIPGSDAVEFKGQTHDEGGIMMDSQTEVEDGETMDQVTMAKKGGKRDYFFSSYLKKGGRSYADMHKDILANGGNQEEINMLAKMQEVAAGRNPNAVKAEKGGVRANQKLNKISKELAGASKMHKGQSIKISDLAKEIGKNKYQLGGRPSMDEIDYTHIPTPPPAPDMSYMDEFNFDSKALSNSLGVTDFQYGNNDIEEEEETYDDPRLAQFEKEQAEMKQRQELYDKALKKGQKGKGTPAEAYVGMGAQLLPAAYAFLHKQKEPDEVSFTKGFSGDVRAGRVKAQKLDRVNYNSERSSADADKRTFDKFVETSGGGPANVSNRLAMHSKNLKAKMAITAAETRANTAIGNQEAQMAQQAETQNVSNALGASKFNAQMNRTEAARQDQIEAINVAARNQFQSDQELNKMNALIATSQGIAGGAGDMMTYKAGERMAKVMGAEGIYQRDIMRNYVAKQAQKNGIPGECGPGECTDDQLNLFVSGKYPGLESE
tara:strand:+ start:4130 stop:6463 length:2334 start_codon:yes stop_codon:yes gene_type:complete